MLALLAGVIAIALQAYVGSVTIYADDLQAKRDELHESIVSNRAPRGGTWAAVGASTLNVRIGAVYLAEGVHRVSGLSVSRTYILLDTIFLFATLVALTLYLRHWFDDVLCLVGLLYFAAVLPMTYFLYAFHPWDRPQLLLWILMLAFVRDRRFLALAGCLGVSMVVKFDSILIPAFYFICNLPHRPWRRLMLESAVLGVVAVGGYLALRWSFPAPNEPSRFSGPAIAQLVRYNLSTLLSMNVKYPPLLAFVVPLSLAAPRLFRRERFVVVSVLFAFILGGIWFLTTHAEEVRAEMVFLVLLLPAALISLRDFASASSHLRAEVDRLT